MVDAYVDVWTQEFQREADNPTYLRFLANSLVAVNSSRIDGVDGVTQIDKSTYQEWCLQADPKKFHKFKANIVDLNGVKVRVICKDWAFSEKASSKVILPHVVFPPEVPLMGLGVTLAAIRSRNDLTEEQKAAQVLEVFDKEIDANQTGNHYRNHYIRARNPYGHE